MDKKRAVPMSNAKNKKLLLGDFLPEDVHHYRINRHSFTIYVGGDPSHPGDNSNWGSEPGVEYMMADRFEINLGILSDIDPNRPILVQMASCGGNWEEGMQMFGGILTCPNPITVLSTKGARSMTSIIPLAADRFVIRPPAKYMYHRGSYGFVGLDHEAETEDIERRRTHELMFRIYVARLKERGKFHSWSPEKIRAMLEDKSRHHIDVWFSADEAKEWGFADAVFDGNHETLRITKKNHARRKSMLNILRTQIVVNVEVS